MAEDKKEIIYKLLQQLPDEKLSVRQIYNLLQEQMSYPTILKWVIVLQAEKRVIIEDYGNIKLVKLNKEFS
ncbi:MAG: hypothetical protein QW727_03920 [Candidatus Pacearchaeota archaeon]